MTHINKKLNRFADPIKLSVKNYNKVPYKMI